MSRSPLSITHTCVPLVLLLTTCLASTQTQSHIQSHPHPHAHDIVTPFITSYYDQRVDHDNVNDTRTFKQQYQV